MASAILQILSGDNAGQTFTIEDAAVIGRDGDVQIRISDRSISRKHARIERRADGFHIVDLGSQNGTKLNGAAVTEKPLPSRCRLLFGTVEAEFSVVMPAVAAPVHAPQQEDGWESIPPGEGVSLDDIFRPPGSLEEIDERRAQRNAEQRKRLLDLAYFAGMILIVVAGVWMFFAIGRRHTLPTDTIIVNRAPLNGRGENAGERLIPYWGKDRHRFARVVVDDESIAQVTQDDVYPWLLCVRGQEIGATKARLVARNGEVLGILTIIVKGEDQDEAVDALRLPDEECIRLARQKLSQAMYLWKESPWRSLKLCEEAVALCRSIYPPPPVYLSAKQKVRELEKIIEDKAQYLLNEARKAQRKPAVAVKYLRDICRLIPDPDDKRHQRAKIIMYTQYPEMMHKPRQR